MKWIIEWKISCSCRWSKLLLLRIIPLGFMCILYRCIIPCWSWTTHSIIHRRIEWKWNRSCWTSTRFRWWSLNTTRCCCIIHSTRSWWKRWSPSLYRTWYNWRNDCWLRWWWWWRGWKKITIRIPIERWWWNRRCTTNWNWCHKRRSRWRCWC